MTPSPPAQLGHAAPQASLQSSAPLRVAVWAFAVAGPALLTVAALPLHSATFRGGFQTSALVLVVTLAVVGGMRPALTALVLTTLGQAFFFAPPFLNPRAGLLPSAIALAAFAIAGVAVSTLTRRLSHLAAEQAAFRRVALLVAQMAPEQELFAAAVEEAGLLTGADYVCLGQYQSGDIVSVAAWRRPHRYRCTSGQRPVFRGLTRAPMWADRGAAMDDTADVCGPLADNARAHGVRSAAVLPIRIGERIWGMMLAGSATRRAPKGCPRGCADSFADLLAAAVASAEGRAELIASRARTGCHGRGPSPDRA